jgi:hypothetical protein
MVVVVAVKEDATTEANAMMPLITRNDDMALDCCIVHARK